MIRKTLCILFSLILLLGAYGCTDVALELDDSSKAEKDPVESTFPESSEETVESSNSSKESSIDITQLEYTTPYPKDYDYEKLKVYYGDSWTLSYDYADEYFNNSVFVGNSIMYHYSNYVSKQRVSDSTFLGNALFFAAPSFSMYNNAHQTPASKDCALPSYRGEAMNITQAVEAMNVGSVYLSLMALNDIAIYKDGPTGIQGTFDLVVELIEELKAKKPQLKIAVLSNTYLHSSRDSSAQKLNNGSINTLNVKVLNYCNSNGIDFIDVATVLLDDNNCLGDFFCSDEHCHLTKYAYNAWTDILRHYATKKQEGTWVNPEELEGILSAN